MEDLGPLFNHISEPWHRQLAGLLLCLAAVSLAVSLNGIVTGRLRWVAAWVGIVVAPLMAFSVGHFALMEDAKRTDFCGECHVMKPVVQSVVAGNAALATRHVAIGAIPVGEACYRCHGGYGVWGGLGAKMNGAVHMLRAVTGTETLPLKTYEPFDVKECLQCHAQATGFRAVETHRMPPIQAALLSGEMGCTGTCHPAAHPAEALMGVPFEP